MLFSEPKIPHPARGQVRAGGGCGFSALQRAENSSPLEVECVKRLQRWVSVLFSEPKIPHRLRRWLTSRLMYRVSVLFSEPKIPHPQAVRPARVNGKVSVLFSEPKIPHQRLQKRWTRSRRRFQCSSASRKFLTRSVPTAAAECVTRFSALQRAENSSPAKHARVRQMLRGCFSALQRAENSSPFRVRGGLDVDVWFQCSSASRKFLTRLQTALLAALRQAVSVLFSEPKIPHPNSTLCCSAS